MHILPAAARIAVGAPFVVLGYDAVAAPGVRVKLAADAGVPERWAEPAVRVNGAVMVVGGLAVVTGVAPRPAAGAVVAAMIPTTLAGHAFWRDTDPMSRKMNRIQFLKNVGMVGGLLAVAALAGKPSCRRSTSADAPEAGS